MAMVVTVVRRREAAATRTCMSRPLVCGARMPQVDTPGIARGRRRRLILPREMTRLTRAELDRLARHYALDSQASATLLDLADARPGSTESLTFLARLFRYAGVLSLGAG